LLPPFKNFSIMIKTIILLIVLFLQAVYSYGQVNTSPIPVRMVIGKQANASIEFPVKSFSNHFFSEVLQSKSGLSNGTFVLDTFYHYSVSPYVYNIDAKDIMALDSFIYLNGSYRDFYPNATKPTNWKPFTMKIGQKGNVIWVRTDSLGPRDHFRTYMHNFIQTVDGNILTMGEYVDFDSLYIWEKSYFIKMDTAGNLLWSKIDSLPLDSGGSFWALDIVAEPDTGFSVQAYTTCKSRRYNYDSSMVLNDTVFISIMRFDKSANLIKMNSFQVGTELIGVMGSGIIKTPDNGYIICGFNSFENDSTNPLYDEKNYMIKLDSNLNHEYTKIFGYTYRSMVSKLNLYVANDGNILFVYPFYRDTSSSHSGYIHYGKMDVSGNVIWEKYFRKVLESNFAPPGWYVVSGAPMGIVQAKNGDIAITAQVSGYHGAYLYCTDSVGNEKWGRWIPYWRELIYGIQNSESEGYLLYGVAAGAWLVKTDSIGCVMPNCLDTMMHIGIEEFEQLRKEKIILYPNPAHAKLQIAINQQGEKVEQVIIYDINGREILNKSFNAYLIDIDISNYKHGVYIVKVIGSNGAIWNKKFIKN